MSKREPSEGERAPEFTLPNAEGKSVSLADFLGRRVVVLYFYPKDDTYGCTVEACSFRDQYSVFSEAGAEVIGVSRDPISAHAKFASKFSLQFQLLSDETGGVWDQYGVPYGAMLGLLTGRTTFVIDKKGIIRQKFSSRVRFADHVSKALEMVQKLSKESDREAASSGA